MIYWYVIMKLMISIIQTHKTIPINIILSINNNLTTNKIIIKQAFITHNHMIDNDPVKSI